MWLFEQPITSIDLIGAFPGTVAPEGYCWTRWSIFSPRENRDVIDDTIFDRIGPTVFKTVLEARNRLSLELVNYGREKCGLTPLEKADLIYPHVPRRRKPKVVLK